MEPVYIGTVTEGEGMGEVVKKKKKKKKLIGQQQPYINNQMKKQRCISPPNIRDPIARTAEKKAR